MLPHTGRHENANRSGGTVGYAKKTMGWLKACVTWQNEAAEWIATGLTHC